MKLTVIIPAYNESLTLARCVEAVYSRNPGLQLEVIIVDDASTDSTPEAAAALKFPGLKYLRHARNQGKGAAIRTALPHVNGDYVIIQDADLEYDPAEYSKLLQPLLAGRVGAVYGSRILGSKRKSTWLFYLGGRLLSWWTNVLYGSSITDEPTCYKLMGAQLLKSLDLRSCGFEFCPEVTGKLLKRGMEIAEVPISYAPRSVEEGKKIKFRDGAVALWTLLKIRLTGRM
ncbi:MAG TPA: glycosyltransferase family 2 protein [Elusimicrobiales bacterium]|nr:glycosyltransferase family 2 protein [Elusimicrobiales bacterium]